MLVVALIRLLAERRHDPPGRSRSRTAATWWPGFHSRWLLCVDGRGWMAQVESSMQHEWGGREHLRSVPPERLRIPD
jgi:hypothetical protein